MEHILKQLVLSRQQARWLEKILDFDFTVKYILGTSNILADTLSRMTGFETGINDNKDITLLKPEHFIRNLRSHYPEEDLVKEIRENAHLRDPQIVKAMKEKNSEWTTEDYD